MFFFSNLFNKRQKPAIPQAPDLPPKTELTQLESIAAFYLNMAIACVSEYEEGYTRINEGTRLKANEAINLARQLLRPQAEDEVKRILELILVDLEKFHNPNPEDSPIIDPLTPFILHNMNDPIQQLVNSITELAPELKSLSPDKLRTRFSSDIEMVLDNSIETNKRSAAMHRIVRYFDFHHKKIVHSEAGDRQQDIFLYKNFSMYSVLLMLLQ